MKENCTQASYTPQWEGLVILQSRSRNPTTPFVNSIVQAYGGLTWKKILHEIKISVISL